MSSYKEPASSYSDVETEMDVLQVFGLDAGGFCVDFKSFLELVNISLFHGHLSLNQEDVLKNRA